MLDFPTFLSHRPFSFSSTLTAIVVLSRLSAPLLCHHATVLTRCRAIVLDSTASMPPSAPCLRPMLSRRHSAHVVPMSPCFLGHCRRFSATAPAHRRAIVRDSTMHSSLVPCCCAPSATFAEQRAPCCRAPPRAVSCPSPVPPPSCLCSVEGKKLTQMYVCLRVQCRSYTLIHV